MGYDISDVREMR